jgi:xanthosine utilization system XapX-like protein
MTIKLAITIWVVALVGLLGFWIGTQYASSTVIVEPMDSEVYIHDLEQENARLTEELNRLVFNDTATCNL